MARLRREEEEGEPQVYAVYRVPIREPHGVLFLAVLADTGRHRNLLAATQKIL